MHLCCCLTVSLNILRQGEPIVARFESWPPANLPEDKVVFGLLHFGDGSQRMLAAMVTWISLLLVWKRHGDEALENPLVSGLISSLLRISTVVRAADTRATPMESMIARIVAQNINSKVQPVSSFGWAGILKQMGGSFEDAVQQYNNHPCVQAFERGETGVGTIALDGRKRQAVKNWVERTSPAAFEVVRKSCDDLPFSQGPFGEGFACTNLVFIGSKANLESNPVTDETERPLPAEAYIEVSWHWPFSVHLCNFPSTHLSQRPTANQGGLDAADDGRGAIHALCKGSKPLF